MQPARRTLASAALAAALVVASCGEVGEPDLGVVPASTTSTTVGAAVEAASEEAAPADEVPFQAQLTLNRPAGFQPEVLVAGSDGVGVLGAEPLLPGVAAERVLDDPTGGLVIETAGVEEGARRIAWFPAAGGQGQTVLEGPYRLLDVGFIDGSVSAIVADERSVRLVRLGEPDERELIALDEGTEVVSLSAAAGLYALVVGDAGCGSLRFLRPDGQPIDVGGVTPPTCQIPGRPAFGLVSFSPDGESFAFTERTFRSDSVVLTTDLVVQDLVRGDEVFRLQIGGEGQVIHSLAIDRNQVLVLRELDGVAELVRVDLRRPAEVAVTPLEGARSVTFTRVPLAAPRPAEPPAPEPSLGSTG